jgi:hypothetical protein
MTWQDSAAATSRKWWKFERGFSRMGLNNNQPSTLGAARTAAREGKTLYEEQNYRIFGFSASPS